MSVCKISIVSLSMIEFSVSVNRDGSGNAVSVLEIFGVAEHCAITSCRKQLSIVLALHSSVQLVSTLAALKRYTPPPHVPYGQRTLYTQAPDYVCCALIDKYEFAPTTWVVFKSNKDHIFTRLSFR